MFASLLTPRNTFFLIFFGCLGLMATGYYMQYAMNLEPCPLCITQRVFIVSVGLTALAAALINPQALGRKIFASFGTIFAIAGGAFSSRQLWLQSLPEDQVPACGPSLEYMLETFPLMDALSVLLRGDGNCAQVSWSLLGISIPGWTLAAFIGLFAFNIYQLVRKN